MRHFLVRTCIMGCRFRRKLGRTKVSLHQYFSTFLSFHFQSQGISHAHNFNKMVTKLNIVHVRSFSDIDDFSKVHNLKTDNSKPFELVESGAGIKESDSIVSLEKMRVLLEERHTNVARFESLRSLVKMGTLVKESFSSTNSVQLTAEYLKTVQKALKQDIELSGVDQRCLDEGLLDFLNHFMTQLTSCFVFCKQVYGNLYILPNSQKVKTLS